MDDCGRPVIKVRSRIKACELGAGVVDGARFTGPGKGELARGTHTRGTGGGPAGVCVCVRVCVSLNECDEQT